MQHFLYSDQTCSLWQLFTDIVDNNVLVKFLEKKHALIISTCTVFSTCDYMIFIS